MEDRIEKRIELKAPLARVWRALTDYREFGEWFRVKLEAPFVPGQVSRGRILYPGIAGGTLLVISESGFDHIPAHRRMEALRMNEGGWALQIRNIESHVAQNA